MRVAVGGFLHETNTFAPSKATFDDFASGLGWGGMLEGEAIARSLGGTNIGSAGFLDGATANGWDVVPTLWTATSPSAHVTEDAFERITARLVSLIASAGPLDAIYLDLHGAMVTEHLDDGEGELLRRLRAQVGDAVPLVVSLDLHANVTAEMVRHADLLESYRTYPHVDMAETGRRAARALAGLVETGRKPAKAFRQAPYLTAISWQCTDLEPAKGLYARVAALAEGLEGISLNMGFPAADIPDCGMSITAYGDGAEAAADTLAAALLAAEPAFKGDILDPEAAVAEALRLAPTLGGPVLLVDTQDNPGAGADSNTAGLLRAMVEAGAPGALGNLFDPATAQAAHAAGAGAEIVLAVGGTSGVPGDTPFKATWRVERLTDGRVDAKGPFQGGRTLNMGPSALLSSGPTRVVVVSGKAQMADREMFRALGVEPEREPMLGIKSSVHYRADFAPIAGAILVVKAPGPMAADPADLPWTRLRPGLRTSPLGEPFGGV
jgi:microcystin degradation protein MlrC